MNPDIAAAWRVSIKNTGNIHREINKDIECREKRITLYFEDIPFPLVHLAFLHGTAE